ncbi:MAG: hypothetical protein JWP75_4136 [Frondihabitans sp.]|nr:hypothetical protein [Frondihabitans sp.]
MKGFDWQAGLDFEVRSVEAFRDVRQRGQGVIVIADVARDEPIAHKPSCWTLTDDHFVKKVVEMGGKNGRYYHFPHLALAQSTIGARPCRHCAPAGGSAITPAAGHRRTPASGNADQSVGGNAPIPLDENAVVAAVCAALTAHGFEIRARAHTTQTGPDIVASREDVELYVEAKGATSSRVGSKRYGRAYGSTDARINVAEALYTAVAVRTRHTGVAVVRAAVALQDDQLHRRLVAPLEPSMDDLRIGRFWVHAGTGEVALDAPWEW